MTNRREFMGRLIVAGPTRTVTGEDGGLVVTAAAIREAINAGLFRGLACFADHTTAGASSVRRLIGVWKDVTWDEATGAAVGRLRAYETDETRPVLDLLEQWFWDGEKGGKGDGEQGVAGSKRQVAGGKIIPGDERADVGISLVFYPRLAADGRTVSGITMVESADVVMFPASVGSRIVGKVTAGELHEEGAAVAVSLWRGGDREQGNKGERQRGSRGTSDKEVDGSATHSHSQLGLYPIAYPLAELMRPQPTASEPRPAARPRTTAERPRDVPTRFSFQFQNKQEREAMAGESTTAAVRRVALVRGTGEPGRGGEREKGSEVEVAQSIAGGQEIDGWLDALKMAAAETVIRASGLPPVVQERLSAGRYETAGEINAAVDRARAELAALTEAGVVQLGGQAQTGMSGLRVRDGLDEARELVGFFFGAAGAPTPPANLRSFGDLYVALTGDVHFRGVFDGGRVLFSGATTSTLPNLAVDAMNRVIAEQFAALDHYRWYERVAAVSPNDGRLHDMKWITMGGIGNLPAVNEGAAYTELSVADAQETAAFVKRGGYVGITREMIKNSDIVQLQAIPRALAAAAVRTRSAAVSALFTANSGVGPTLAQDSKALFHADHANLATTALGADATAWRAARSECFQQAELGSAKPLGIFPRFLLVPAELYDTALSILGYGEGMPTTYTPEAQSRGFADPRPVPLVVPDWTDATDWAYIVDPALFPVIQMSYSQAPGGRQHPIPELFAVVSETSGLMFSNDVLPIKVRDEFAVGVNGARGIGKRNVA